MSESATTTEPRTITVWVCDECDYWRPDKSTGVHQTFRELPYAEQKLQGRRTRVHELREATFVEVCEVERLRAKLAEYDKYVGEFTNNA